jgi:hypothetical protein
MTRDEHDVIADDLRICTAMAADFVHAAMPAAIRGGSRAHVLSTEDHERLLFLARTAEALASRLALEPLEADAE